MQNLKTLTLSIIIGLTFAGTLTFAAWATATWNDTNTWISNGAPISAQKIAENFEWLKNQVAQGGIWSQNGSNAYYNNGNIGIGTSNPLAKLVVVPASAGRGIEILSQSAGNTHLPWTNNWNYISGNGVIFRNTSNIEKVRINTTTGNVQANAYCDMNGQNCKTATQLGGGGSGSIAGGGHNSYESEGWMNQYTIHACLAWGRATCSGSTLSCPSGTFKFQTGSIPHSFVDTTNSFYPAFLCITN